MKLIPPPSENKRRLNYIDIAKGILILMVIYGHTGNLAVASSVNNEVINFIPETTFFKPFIMPAFFVIAGLCSNYNKSFREFLVSNAKALLIPAVLLLFVRMAVRFVLTGTFSTLEWGGITSKSAIFNFGYWNWFLTALFFTKLLFYALLHVIKSFKVRLAIILLIHVLGVVYFNMKGDGIIFYNFFLPIYSQTFTY